MITIYYHFIMSPRISTYPFTVDSRLFHAFPKPWKRNENRVYTAGLKHAMLVGMQLPVKRINEQFKVFQIEKNIQF